MFLKSKSTKKPMTPQNLCCVIPPVSPTKKGGVGFCITSVCIVVKRDIKSGTARADPTKAGHRPLESITPRALIDSGVKGNFICA
ncbi:hypothetical protein AOLI_G00258380 [Acnodon oligacanthus]